MLRVEGRIANHDGSFDGAVLIDESTGLIENVGPCTGASDLDTAGCLIFPGFGDIHIHAREDASGAQVYKEDFATASAAAVQGGVVQMADMPNNPVAPVDDARYAEKERLTQKSAVHITHVPYKAFMGPSVGDLFFRSQAELEGAIAHYRGRNVSFHCEDPVILEASKGAPTHESRRPAVAEITATEFALYLIEAYELVGKLCHYSTGEGLKLIAAAKARGVRVTAEVTPHHLYFDDAMLADENRLWLQMNPPLRSPADRLAMIEALRSGLVDCIATDHAPHTIAEKMKGVSGVPLLDTYGAFATWLMVEHGFTAEEIARVCAWNPGRFVKEFLPSTFGEGYGKVAPGYVGSLTIIDMKTPWLVRREQMKTKCAWSPFEGVTFPGRVRYTVLQGKVHGEA
jgi:dihydroorotase